MKLTNTIRDAFIRAVLQDVPAEDYTEQARALITADAVAALPPKVRALWNDKALRDYVATSYRHQHRTFSAMVPGRSDTKLSAETLVKLDELSSEFAEQKKRISNLRSQLHGVAYSVSTRKALADALPEFAKYLPADERAANRSLPVIANVVASFVAAGWPKGAKKSAKAVA